MTVRTPVQRTAPPSARTLAELRASGVQPRSLRAELRANLEARLRKREALFSEVRGYEETVVPAVENALLSGHDLIFLGERGQAKTRMIRAMTELLDEWIPVIAGSEVNDDPFAPISRFGIETLARQGEATEVGWLHRDDRYTEKLATPDVSIGDLIGDVDPIKVAEGRYLSDELVIHFGLLPRANRGLFCINELPDLTEKVQVGLFNVMEERDVQVKGFRVRLPLDLIVVASANPEDYTSRGRIITPLKDRYAAQIRTHYPPTREIELEIVRQEVEIPEVDGIELIIPPFMEAIVGQATFEARASADVSQSSGVSVRMTIANYETLAAAALRRALRLGEAQAVPRIADLAALQASSTGKLELEYAGVEQTESEIVDGLMRRAVRVAFDEFVPLEGVASVVEAFDQGWRVEVSADMPADEYLEGLDEIPGLREAATLLAGDDSAAALASSIEFLLEGLHLSNRLNKSASEKGALYGRAPGSERRVKRWTYSRWDGTQSEFSLDARRVLDALSELLMEGLDTREALEWMRQQGFELGGLDMRVMGTEELANELRDQIRELESQYDLSRSMREMAERFDAILDREEGAQRAQSGYESARMNDFLQRRHAGDERLSDAIERFRDHEFADEQAGDDFKELLDEVDRMRQLENFLNERGERFRGPQSADYDKAQEIRERVEQLEQMAQNVMDGNFAEVSPEALQELLGDQAGQSWILLRDLEQTMRDQGMLRGDVPELTPRAIRHIGASALADVFSSLRKGLHGDHETPDGRGVTTPKPDETRPWRFGDPLDLDVVRSVMNGVKRRVGERGAGAPGAPTSLRAADGRVRLTVDDFEVREFDTDTQATTVLLLDMSWSMSWAGRFPAAKRVALAMDQLIRTQYPRDHFFVVGFATRAREIPIRELPEVCWDMGDPFTNLQDGLRIAQGLIRQHPSAAPQILVITDGQPTAYFAKQELHVEWPMGFGGVSPHAVAETMRTVRDVTRMGVTINTFMLDDAPELVGFVERMTQVNRGRAFYSSPTQLGSFLMVDYIAGRKLKRS